MTEDKHSRVQTEIPIIQILGYTTVYKIVDVPLIVINLLTDSVYLSKGEIMGFIQSQSLDISEITTESSTEPSPILLEEDDDIEELKEQKKKITLEYTEMKFITSPADIDIHRKVDLQDADVTEEQQKAFKELCDECKDIFSRDSSNIGKSPLIEMEIDTSDSPPITQRPYTLPLKTCYLGTERVGNFRESWCNSEKCFTLG